MAVGGFDRGTAIEGDRAVPAIAHPRGARLAYRPGQHLKQHPHRHRADPATQIPQRLGRRIRHLVAAQGRDQFRPHLLVAQPGEQAQRQHEVDPHP